MVEEGGNLRESRRLNRRNILATILPFAICAVVCALTFVHVSSPTETELLLDSDTIANKILNKQHFHKASQEERERILKGILSKGPAGSLATKMAKAVSDKHETYRQRIDAMKKLLDMHTNSLKEGPKKKKIVLPKRLVTSVDHTPPKAIKEAEKLLDKHNKDLNRRLKLSKKDAQIKKETEHAAADPKKLDSWMKQQVKKKSSVDRHTASLKAKGRETKLSQAPSPASASHFHARSGHAKAKSGYAALVKWAEAHGLPKKLANDPSKRTKVKDIIARMKADLEVERIRQQFAQDDAHVGDVIHTADPGAAGDV